jgi:hypothetical protein
MRLIIILMFLTFHQIGYYQGVRIKEDEMDGACTAHGRDKKCTENFFGIPGNFSLHHCVQNGSGAHPASYTMGTGGSFPGDKAAGA